MFKTARMQKFRVIFNKRAHDDVVAGLHEAGVVQLKEISELEVARKALGEEVYEISALLTKFKEAREFIGPPPGKPVETEELPYGQTFERAQKFLERFEPKLTALKAKMEELDQKKQELLAQMELLRSFLEIRFPLSYLRSTDEIHVVVGQIDEERVPEFSDAVGEALGRKVFVAVLGKGEHRILIVACRTGEQPKLSPVLYRHDVELLEIPPIPNTPRKALRMLEKQLKELDREQAELEGKRKKLAKARSQEVSTFLELLEIHKERLECGGLFGYTDATVVMEGWVPVKLADEFEPLLGAATNGRHVFRTYVPQKADVEAVPVELENPKVIEDFEYVTNMYGLPKYDEIDPTPFMTLTFAMFFAIALSDAGYGIALGLFMASGFWFAKMFPRKLRRMMVLCAIFTVIIGLLIGGWFGFGQGLWVNPIERPIPLLKLVVFIGIIHLLVAFGLAGAMKDLFRRDWKSLIFGRVSRALILIGFFGLSFCILGIGLHEFGINYTFPKTELFAAFNPFAPAATTIVAFRILFYLGLGMGMVGAVLVGKGAGEKIGGPINVVYGITGLIADVTSYTRLLALGIATGVIAFSINFIIGFAWAGMMPTELTPLSAIYAGLLLIGFAFVFIAGHCFNIFINSLGGFIHTMRLHFAEFFGKFYEAGGEKFTPFKAKRTFTISKRG
jgi:V/A-type H+-transporting ATPase subunit I